MGKARRRAAVASMKTASGKVRKSGAQRHRQGLTVGSGTWS